MTDIVTAQPIRTFRLIQYITGYVECEQMSDLPALLQDKLYEALEAKAHEVELPLTIVAVRCDKDIDSEDPKREFFLEVIASEIVMGIDAGRLN